MPTGSRTGRATGTPLPTLARGISPTPRATLSRPGTLTPHSPASSEEAQIVIVDFANQHLGVNPDLLYAGVWDGNTNQTGDSSQQTLDQILSQLPTELQQFIETSYNGSATSYWGVYKTGAGVVVLGDCTNNPNCTFDMDNLNVYLTSSSGGVYGTYTTGTVSSADAALKRVQTTYPALAAVKFTAVKVQQGFAFQATTTIGSNKQAITTFIDAGVVNVGQQSLVYALVAVGEGYVKLAQG
jgi:hypothetical protein